MNLIKSLYIVAIGLLVAAFIGFGIDTFYPSPKAPEYPVELQYKTEPLNAQQQELQKAFDQSQKDYQTKLSDYNQNVSVIAIIFSLLILAASIIGLSKIDIIGDGTTLGGVFLLFYGIGRAFGTEKATYRFIAITVALVVIIALTYWKFLRGKVSFSTTSK